MSGLGLLLLAAAVGPAQPAAIGTLRELGPALVSCFRAPSGSAGSQLTVRLTLTRGGAVLGKPQITYSHLVGRPDDQRAFVEAVLGSLAACTPVAVTPGLGGAIAGRPLSIRFVGGGPAQPI